MRKAQGVKRTGPGKYQVTVVRTHPTECRPDGRPLKVKRKRVVNGSRREAERVHDQLAEELEMELGLRAPPPARMTLSDYVQQWLELRVPKLKRSTVEKYVNDLEKHILPVLGNRMLDEIRPSDVKAMLVKDKGAPNSQKNRLRVLSAVAKDALDDGLIDRDFCRRVSVKVPAVYTEEEPNSLTNWQLSQLLKHFEDEEWLDALYLMAFTGLRWCEVAGLQWGDFDQVKGVLRIRRANVKGHIGEPKTENSRRVLPLPWIVVNRLCVRHQRMVAEKHPGLVKGWVFCNEDGSLHRGYPMNHRLRKACKAAEIPIRFTQHGLRRTWNNLARPHIDGGVLREIVGHADEVMTDHYSTYRLAEKRDGMERVVQAVTEATPDEDADARPTDASAGMREAMPAGVLDGKPKGKIEAEGDHAGSRVNGTEIGESRDESTNDYSTEVTQEVTLGGEKPGSDTTES